MRFTETQIVNILKLADSGMKGDDICRQNEISNVTYYIYGLPPFCKYRIYFWVVAYIHPVSGKSVSKWVIRTQSSQQLDGL
ncbi:hypothetical protein D3H37_11230 [Proteus mirabilis]|nr:hypothetical protein [Proteus mirabilis]NBM83395.1 hypothetical protein [Proteus sp. G4404]NBN15767.1 hypothetical protein [Proteus sp. G4398]NBN19368.1 hypothetical protein [Proteus sp. G4400]MVD50019.1 hypothetical protein [Proteus mirabilis]